MSLPKVFVCAPINVRKDYVLDEYFANILKFTYPNKQFFFCDNSPNPKYATDKIKQWGFDVEWFNPKGMRNQDYIRDSMNIIRQRFLESDCDYMFNLECDLLPPPNIIEQLMSWEVQVVSAPYFLGEGAGSFLSNTEIETSFGTIKDNRHLGWYDGFLDFKAGLIEAQQCGLGCSLITRDVMEQVEFITIHNRPAHHDTYFYYVLHDLGIKSYWDTSVIVEHKNKSWRLVPDAQQHG